MIPTITIRRDGGWAWLALIGGFFHLFIAALPFSIGVYVNEVIIDLRVDHSTAGLFGAMQLATIYMGGWPTFLSEKVTHRVVIFVTGVVASLSFVASIYTTNIYILFITFAILPGLCIGAVFLQSVIVVNRFFDKYSGIANGVTFAGCGLGSIIIPFIYDHIIERYSWRPSLYIVAGITLQACVFAMFMRPIKMPVDNEQHTKSQEIRSNATKRSTLFKNPHFYIFLVNNILWSGSMGGVIVLGPNFFYECKMTNDQISMLLALIGVGNFAVRIAIGFILHLREWNLVAVHVTMTMLMAGVIAMFVTYTSFLMFAIASFLFGICYGATTVTQALVPRVFAGIHNYGTAYGYSVGVCAVGVMGGPALTGYIYDTTQNYVTAFLINSGLAVSAALLLSTTFCFSNTTPADEQTLTVKAAVDGLSLDQVSLRLMPLDLTLNTSAAIPTDSDTDVTNSFLPPDLA